MLAGEILDEPWLLDYGRQRLANQVGHIATHGGVDEFNSPTYMTDVVLLETERLIHLARDARARELAESLRRHAWQVIAGHFHQPTQQWAGPSQRTYSDRLSPWVAEVMRVRVLRDGSLTRLNGHGRRHVGGAESGAASQCRSRARKARGERLKRARKRRVK